MTRIKNLIDQLKEEICSAKDYSEEYLTFKAKGDSSWATKYKTMAEQELLHASYIHDRIVAEITELRKVYTPPEEMMEKWEHEHREYIEKVAWVKQMLAM